MLKFRKNELFWLKSWCFGCANSRKRRFQGRFSGGKRVESGVSLVKCVISVHVQLRSPTNVLLEKTQKNPVPPHSGIVVSRLENGLFFVIKSRNFVRWRVVKLLRFWTFLIFSIPKNYAPPSSQTGDKKSEPESHPGKKNKNLSEDEHLEIPGCDRPIFRVQLFLSSFSGKLDFWMPDSKPNLAAF